MHDIIICYKTAVKEDRYSKHVHCINIESIKVENKKNILQSKSQYAELIATFTVLPARFSNALVVYVQMQMRILETSEHYIT